MAGVGDEIDLVAGKHLVVAAGDDRLIVTDDRHDFQVEVGEQACELAQRRVQDRAFIGTDDADNANLAIRQRDHVEGAGHLEPAGHGAGDFDLRRDDDVDRHVLAGEQVGPDRRQIALVTDAGDLGRDVEQRMGNLTCHHVDLVGQRDRDDHVGLGGASLLKHIGVGSKSNHRLNVQGVADLLDQLRRLVDHGDVVVLGREVARDVGADLTRAADDDLHWMVPAVGAAALSIFILIPSYPDLIRVSPFRS